MAIRFDAPKKTVQQETRPKDQRIIDKNALSLNTQINQSSRATEILSAAVAAKKGKKETTEGRQKWNKSVAQTNAESRDTELIKVQQAEARNEAIRQKALATANDVPAAIAAREAAQARAADLTFGRDIQEEASKVNREVDAENTIKENRANVEALQQGESFMQRAERKVRESIAKAEGRVDQFGAEIGSRKLSVWERMKVVAQAGGDMFVGATSSLNILNPATAFKSRMAKDAGAVALAPFEFFGDKMESVAKALIGRKAAKAVELGKRVVADQNEGKSDEEIEAITIAHTKEELQALGEERQRDAKAEEKRGKAFVKENESEEQQRDAYVVGRSMLIKNGADREYTDAEIRRAGQVEIDRRQTNRNIDNLGGTAEHLFKFSMIPAVAELITPKMEAVWKSIQEMSTEVQESASNFKNKHTEQVREANDARRAVYDNARLAMVKNTMSPNIVAETQESIAAIRAIDEDPNIGTEIESVEDEKNLLNAEDYDQLKHVRNPEVSAFENMQNGSKGIVAYLEKIEDKNLMGPKDTKELEEIRRMIQEALADDDDMMLFDTLERLQKATKTMKGPNNTPAQAVMNYLGKITAQVLEDKKLQESSL